MQLLMLTDYALRALLYVGAHPGAPVSAATIAEGYGISTDHVAKAAKALTREGFFRATRGANGGVMLARPAATISVGEIVRLFEGKRALVECLQEGGSCAIASSCRLQRAIERAEDAFFRELDGCSLADLLENRAQLVRLLRKTPRREPAAGRSR